MTNHSGLTLITNDKFKKVLKDSCKVTLDGEVTTHDEFVVIATDKVNGDTVMFKNADPIVIARAALIINQMYLETFSALSVEEQEEIMTYV